MRRQGKVISRLFSGQTGLTLIEVVVSVALIAAIGVSVINAIDTNARTRRVLDEKVQATNLVTAYLEAIRQVPYSDDANAYSYVGDSITKPPQYIVTINVTYSPDGVNWFTDNNSGAYKLQKLVISVLRQGGKPVLSTCTFRTPRIK